MGDCSNSDTVARAEICRATALRKEAQAAAFYRLALDCGRWGLCEAEAEARHTARALTIAALLDNASAGAMCEQAARLPRLIS